MDSFTVPAGKRLQSERREPSRNAAATAIAIAVILIGPLTAHAQHPDDDAAKSTPVTERESVRQQGGEGFLFRTPIVTLGMRAGFNFARAGSTIFDETTDVFTLERSDFNAFAIAGDIAIRLVEAVDIVFTAAHASTSKRSEYLDWVDQDDLPITQRTTFAQTPLTAGARVYLLPRGRQVGRFAWIPEKIVPYVGANAGAIHYRFRQIGSFINFWNEDLPIFDDTIESDAWAPVLAAGAGANYSMGTRVILNADVRYQWASADVVGDFIGYDDGIDLNGLQLSAGVHFRF